MVIEIRPVLFLGLVLSSSPMVVRGVPFYEGIGTDARA
jgi:hypothetical protein